MKVVGSILAIQAIAVIMFLAKQWNLLKSDKMEFPDVIDEGNEL